MHLQFYKNQILDLPRSSHRFQEVASDIRRKTGKTGKVDVECICIYIYHTAGETTQSLVGK